MVFTQTVVYGNTETKFAYTFIYKWEKEKKQWENVVYIKKLQTIKMQVNASSSLNPLDIIPHDVILKEEGGPITKIYEDFS